MLLLLTSFLAGILTVLAPCVLILLPVIVGSSLAHDDDKKLDRWKPYIISISLGVSVLLFTLLLKASTSLIGVDPLVWKSISGGIVILLGLSLLFPLVWTKLIAKSGLENNTNSFLARASKKSGIAGYILTGAALGPVFAACSPVYSLILATVLPVNLALGLVYIAIYSAGLSVALLAIALAGRRLTKRLNFTAKPNGWFRRGLAILLILVGLAVITGYDKTVQTWLLVNAPFNSTKLEEKLIPASNSEQSGSSKNKSKGAMFNVKPYDAPEIQDINNWINSDPQTIANLKGKVVLIDFWTYSCINCIRTQPYLNDWHDKYNDDGLVILGLHAPEFAFEKVPENVRKAVKEADIKYAVGLDNNFGTWRAYDNQYWPAKYLIDKDGQVRYTHFGEGDYEETEAAIQALLKESGRTVSDTINKDKNSSRSFNGQTPETYLGYERGERFANADQFKANQPVDYKLANDVPEHTWSLGGKWQIGDLESVSKSDDAVLRISASAKEIYLVMSGPTDRPVTLKLNGKQVTATNGGDNDVAANGDVLLTSARLYRLIKLPEFTRGSVLDITVPKDTTVNAFTFGS